MEEQPSFSAYYNQYKHQVFSYFYYRLNGDRTTAEDLTGDVFVKAYEHFDAFNPNRKFYSWVFAIVRNTLTDYFRTQKKYADLEEGIEVSDANSESFVRNVDNDMKMEKVHEVLDEIPSHQKECVLLKYLGDLTNREIALATERTEENVRQLLSRALRALRSRKELFYIFILCLSTLLQ